MGKKAPARRLRRQDQRAAYHPRGSTHPLLTAGTRLSGYKEFRKWNAILLHRSIHRDAFPCYLSYEAAKERRMGSLSRSWYSKLQCIQLLDRFKPNWTGPE